MDCSSHTEKPSLLEPENPEKEHDMWSEVKRKFHLTDFHALPEYLRDNEFIHRGYRVNFSVYQALLSIVRLHNETGNIWTHLLGFFVFLWLTIYTAASWSQMKSLPPFPNFQDLTSLASVELPMLHNFSNALPTIEFPSLYFPESLSSCFNHSTGNNSLTLNAEGCLFANFPKLHIPLSLSSCFSSMEKLDNKMGKLQDPCIFNSVKNLQLPERFSSCFQEDSLEQESQLSKEHCIFPTLWLYFQTHLLHVPQSLSSCFQSAEPSFGSEKDRERCFLVHFPFNFQQRNRYHFETISQFFGDLKQNFSQDLVSGALESLNHSLKLDQIQPITRWPFFIFLFGAMICLFTSSTCHLLGCHSKRLNDVLWRFDYAGIAILITASFYPPVYYGFLCEPSYQILYLVSLTIIGVAAVLVSLLDVFQSKSFRTFRAAIFFGMGACGIVPMLHKLITSWDENVVIVTTFYLLIMGALYGLGAVFYASRIPERWLPGKFDFAGHSHQIFHVLVVAGALTHYLAGLEYLKWRDSSSCGSGRN